MLIYLIKSIVHRWSELIWIHTDSGPFVILTTLNYPLSSRMTVMLQYWDLFSDADLINVIRCKRWDHNSFIIFRQFVIAVHLKCHRQEMDRTSCRVLQGIILQTLKSSIHIHGKTWWWVAIYWMLHHWNRSRWDSKVHENRRASVYWKAKNEMKMNVKTVIEALTHSITPHVDDHIRHKDDFGAK